MNKRKRDDGVSRWLAPLLGAGFAGGASALGFPQLAPAAGAMGMAIGQGIKDITGYGAYSVKKNTLMSGSVPSVGNETSVENGTCISHKEYLGDVITSATANTFAISGYDLNPANSQIWEWLAQIACNYEEWVPEGILFYYKSTSGDSITSTNTSLGTVIMATNYNVYNQAFTTKAEMESYEFVSNGPPNNDIIHPVECDPHQGSISTYYMSSYNQSGSQGIMDKRFQTLGTFYLATTGFQGTSVNIGELWVTYQITLLKPKLYASLGFYEDSIQLSQTTPTTAASGLLQLKAGAFVMYRNTIPYTGSTPSTALWIENITNGVRIHFPVYGYGTSYNIVMYNTIASQVVPTVGYASSPGAYNAIYQPYQIYPALQSPPTGATSTTMMYTIQILNVPGGFIPTDTNTPYIETSFAPTGNVTTNYIIAQIPFETTQNTKVSPT